MTDQDPRDAAIVERWLGAPCKGSSHVIGVCNFCAGLAVAAAVREEERQRVKAACVEACEAIENELPVYESGLARDCADACRKVE